MKVYYTHRFTEIQDRFKSPIVDWVEKKIALNIGEIRKMKTKWRIPLEAPTVDEKEILIYITWPSEIKDWLSNSWRFTDFKYFEEAGTPYISLDMIKFNKDLQDIRLTDVKTEIGILMRYPAKRK